MKTVKIVFLIATILAMFTLTACKQTASDPPSSQNGSTEVYSSTSTSLPNTQPNSSVPSQSFSSSEVPASASEPDYVFENPSMNPDGTYPSGGLLHGHTRVLTENMMEHLRSTLNKSAYGGVYLDYIPSPDEPQGICILNIWVVEKDVVQSAINSYPSEKCEIYFKETEYSLKDFETAQQEIEQMEICKAFKVDFSIYEERNTVTVIVPTEDTEALAELREYMEANPLGDHLRLVAQSTPNPDT